MKKLLAIVFVATTLVGCQTAPKHTATISDDVLSSLPQHALIKKVVRPQNKTIAYFDANWKLSKTPVVGGYYRKLYGKTVQGHYIAQDFYQDTQTKQVDPFETINEQGLITGDNCYNTGNIIWYNQAGQKTNLKWYDNGRYTGLSKVYRTDGTLAMSATPYIPPKSRAAIKPEYDRRYIEVYAYAPNVALKEGLAKIIWYDGQPARIKLMDKQGIVVFQSDLSVHNKNQKVVFSNKQKGKKHQIYQEQTRKIILLTNSLIPEYDNL